MTHSARRLETRGIGTAVHYPTPIHFQPAYTELNVAGGFPVAEELITRIVSLPISADHTNDEVGRGRRGDQRRLSGSR